MYHDWARAYLMGSFKDKITAVTKTDISLNVKLASDPYSYLIQTVPTKAEEPYKRVASFYLQPFPANCGAMLVYWITVYYPYTSHGLGNLMVQFTEEITKAHGYTYLIGTVATHTQPFIEKILAKREWKMIDSFKNQRSSNSINTWRKLTRV